MNYKTRGFPVGFLAGFLIYLVSTSGFCAQFTFTRKLTFNCNIKEDDGSFTSLPRKVEFSKDAKISSLGNTELDIQTSSSASDKNYQDSKISRQWIPLDSSVSLSRRIDSLRVRSATKRSVSLLINFSSIEETNKDSDEFATVDIIERNEWGAKLPANDYSEHFIDSIVIHHSWFPDQKSYKEAQSIYGIQKYHMNSNGWDDIGYHYLIGPGGLIFRGRPEEVSGAHCVPNSGKVGICLLGNYDPECDPLPEKGWDSLKKLTVAISSKHDVPPDMIFGHRDFSPKSCPGETVYKAFPELKAMVPFPSKYRNNESESVSSLIYLASDKGEYTPEIKDKSSRGD